MKKHCTPKYRSLVAATLAWALTTPAWATQPADTAKVSDELRATLRQHHEALNQHNLKALLALYDDIPSVALMGSGPGEFWKGKAAVEDTYQHYFETFKAGSLSNECPEIIGVEDGSSAWLMASCIMKDTDPAGQPREFGLNISAVLKKEKAGWRFQAMHFSNLVGIDDPPMEEDAAPETTPVPKPEAAPKKVE